MERVVFQPQVSRRLKRGIDVVVNALRPTIGPLARHVVVARQASAQPPDMLDDGAIIARRLIQLPNRDEDVGAMLVRHMIERLHTSVGDGTATAALLFQAVFDEGIRHIASGGSPMLLRRHLEAAIPILDEALCSLQEPVHGRTAIAKLAESICHDPALATGIAQALSVVGEHGRIDVRQGGCNDQVDFVEGLYWEGGTLGGSGLERSQAGRITLHDAAVLISDLELDEPRQLAEFIARVIQTGKQTLLLIASSLSERATGLLNMVNEKPGIRVIGAKSPFADIHQRAVALQDLALLTGGRVITGQSGQSLGNVTADDIGTAQTVWTDRLLTGLVGGGGNANRIGEQLSQLRAAFGTNPDEQSQRRLRSRISWIMGGLAILWVSGNTAPETERRKALAERTIEALRGALAEGAVIGGGVALLACRKKLMAKQDSHDDDARAAFRMVSQALTAPFEALVTNAGYEAGTALAAVEKSGYRRMFDVYTGTVSDAQVMDSARVLRTVVRQSISTAALALTIDTVVHRSAYDREVDLPQVRNNHAAPRRP